MSKDLRSAKITVAFYFGPDDNPLYRLNKKYVVKRWKDEADLRQLVDDIASEMNHLSGYGIFSIQIVSNRLKFTVDYKDKFVPYDQEEMPITSYWFDDSLRFTAGAYPGGGPVWLEIPRLRVMIGPNEPLQLYEAGDSIFKIRVFPFSSRKKRRGKRTRYNLNYDRDNPFLVSFCHKIAEGLLVPNTRTDVRAIGSADPELTIRTMVSWWRLPKGQTTFHQLKKRREQEEKRKKAEERKKRQLQKAGIVYKDEKGQKKAQQVYVIQMVDDGLSDALYKIGISRSPGKRLQTLNTSSPFELELVHKFMAEPAEEAEAKLHEKFNQYRMSGEWFKLPPDQVSELREILEYREGKFVTDDEETEVNHS